MGSDFFGTADARLSPTALNVAILRKPRASLCDSGVLKRSKLMMQASGRLWSFGGSGDSVPLAVSIAVGDATIRTFFWFEEPSPRLVRKPPLQRTPSSSEKGSPAGRRGEFTCLPHQTTCPSFCQCDS